jgi:hypothetical protein
MHNAAGNMNEGAAGPLQCELLLHNVGLMKHSNPFVNDPVG